MLLAISEALGLSLRLRLLLQLLRLLLLLQLGLLSGDGFGQSLRAGDGFGQGLGAGRAALAARRCVNERLIFCIMGCRRWRSRYDGFEDGVEVR